MIEMVTQEVTESAMLVLLKVCTLLSPAESCNDTLRGLERTLWFRLNQSCCCPRIGSLSFFWFEFSGKLSGDLDCFPSVAFCD